MTYDDTGKRGASYEVSGKGCAADDDTGEEGISSSLHAMLHEQHESFIHKQGNMLSHMD